MDNKTLNFIHRARKRYYLPNDCSIEECRKHYDEELQSQERIVNQLVLISRSLDSRGLKYAFAMHLVYSDIIKHYTHFYQLSIKNQVSRLRRPNDIELYSNIIKSYIDWDSDSSVKQTKGIRAKRKIDAYFKSQGY